MDLDTIRRQESFMLRLRLTTSEQKCFIFSLCDALLMLIVVYTSHPMFWVAHTVTKRVAQQRHRDQARDSCPVFRQNRRSDLPPPAVGKLPSGYLT